MIAIVDVCSGNLRSVERAIERAGGRPVVTSDPDVVRRADKLVVPGQGAFRVFMEALVDARGLGHALAEFLATGRPYFGICLGLQVLFDESEEQGPCAGLGLIPGRVVKLRPADRRLKVPHMGWNRVSYPHDHHTAEPLLAGVGEHAYLYFVHSYHAVPEDHSIVALEAQHGGPITAAIRKGNLFACQFHPEKSQALGLAILKNFVEAA